MAKTETKKADVPAGPSASKSVTVDRYLNSGGTAVEGKVIHGRKTKLTAKEQGQLARGEIDEAGDPTGKEVQPNKFHVGVRVGKPTETLYQGKFTLHGIAAATGEPISVVCVQEEPTTEDGLFYHFQQYHPSAIRKSFKIDAENTSDPTLRTHLE